MKSINGINDLNESENRGLSHGELSSQLTPHEFLDLWMPFEIEIGRLTEATPAAGESEPALRQAALRRELLERVLHEAENGDEDARKVVGSLEAVMSLFASRVLRIVESGEFESPSFESEKLASVPSVNTGEGRAGGQGSSPSGSTPPGTLALRQLAQDTEFLRHATAYSTRLHVWTLAAVTHGRLDMARPGEHKPLAPRSRLLPDELHFCNDAVHATAVKALSHVSEWQPLDDFAFGFQHSHDKASVIIGLPNGQSAASLWEYLRSGGPRMVKAHYALWARYYHDVDEGGLSFAIVHVPQFCADIGLKKHKNGGYRREQKQEAAKILQALTSIVMSVQKTVGKKVLRVRGPLWSRGLEAESQDAYGDLFGSSRAGEKELWEPVAFSFAPGPWFHDPDWRRYHRYVGKVGAGLLRLDNREDWAILIGGYLAMAGRTNQYAPLRLRVSTVLENSGLAQSKDGLRRVSQNRGKLENALDRLASEEIGVILSWRYEGCNIYEPDMDDPNSLAEYSQSQVDPPGDWRNWMVEISLPFEDQHRRLQARKEKAIKKVVGKAKNLKGRNS